MLHAADDDHGRAAAADQGGLEALLRRAGFAAGPDNQRQLTAV
jgi:hypothetical protein